MNLNYIFTMNKYPFRVVKTRFLEWSAVFQLLVLALKEFSALEVTSLQIAKCV